MLWVWFRAPTWLIVTQILGQILNWCKKKKCLRKTRERDTQHSWTYPNYYSPYSFNSKMQSPSASKYHGSFVLACGDALRRGGGSGCYFAMKGWWCFFLFLSFYTFIYLHLHNSVWLDVCMSSQWPFIVILKTTTHLKKILRYYLVAWLYSILYLAYDMGLHYLTFLRGNLNNRKKLTLVWIMNSVGMNNMNIANNISIFYW